MLDATPTEIQTEGAAADELPPPTAPENMSISLRCFDTEVYARAFGDLVATYVRTLSRYIDLTALDGITIAFDYPQALLDLDRGYETKHKLTPSEGIVLGVAMTPAVIRDGKIKSHMLFNAGVLLPLEDEQNEFYEQALHTLAHECAHVEVTERYNLPRRRGTGGLASTDHRRPPNKSRAAASRIPAGGQWPLRSAAPRRRSGACDRKTIV
ncbi:MULTISPECIES: hypothetical protein [unclassified Bradyrhizobium]|uniref:hypothetical protein n=1 Tax=unclassified Bradyrhizobium TaxID=2631580 RepID=UPI00291651A9|nr:MULTISPECIES: hypothetical protein [unclassified Bradyrhizobium]